MNESNQQYNYEVEIWGGHDGRIEYYDTPEEVWEALGKRRLGQGYTVGSPTGRDVSEFVPF